MKHEEDANQLFFEESRQLIESLETVAMELERDPGAAELVAEAFRFLHTLKGAAAMYGFTRAADVAHEVETIFDAIRRQGVAVPLAVSQMLLNACDVLGLLVTPAAKDVSAFAAEVLALRSLVAELGESDVAGDVTPGNAQPTSPTAGQVSTFVIRLIPDRGIFRRGVDLAGTISEVVALGESVVHMDFSAVPDLEHIDPEECRISALIEVRTDAGIPAIESSLLFLGSEEYSIELARSGDAPGDADHTVSFRRGAGTELEGRSVRVSSDRLDVLVDLVGEVVNAQTALSDIVGEDSDPRLLIVSEMLERLTQDLRESVLTMRMVPIGTTFSRFRRHVRDLATELDKQVVLVAEGGDTQLDKSVIERVEEPLVHVIRNSLDHGIESPAARRKAGKPAEGTITLSAFQQSGYVFVRIEDDGQGFDMVSLERRAREQGLLADGEVLTPDKTTEIVCSAGFTTANRVTSVSGRGVGLDVVKRTVEQLQGSIDVRSERGKGTIITIRLP